MSRHQVISEVSNTLRTVLWHAFETGNTNGVSLSSEVGSREAIRLSNPTEVIREHTGKFSLWLYNLWENEFLRNIGEPSPQPPPLTLTLRFMLTAITNDTNMDQILLGRAMEAFHSRPTIMVPAGKDTDGTPISEEISLKLMRLTLEDMSRIWDALSEPYRLSVCYEVRGVCVHAGNEPAAEPVTGRFEGARRRAS